MHAFTATMFRSALLTLTIPLLTGPAQAAPPAAAQAHIAEFRDALRGICEPVGDFEVLEGFATPVDLNGDGIDDYILTTDGVACHGARSIYTGASGGAITRLVLSRDDGGFGIFEGQYRDLAIVTHDGMTMLQLGYHGSACGGVGADPCRRVAGFVEDEAFTIAWLDPNTRVSASEIDRERQRFFALRGDGGETIAAAAPSPVTQATSTYTPSFGETCTDIVARPEFSQWICPGPDGRSVTFADIGMRFGVTFGEEGADPDFEPLYQPSENGVGDVIEWRLTADDEAFATIFRAFTVRNPDDLRSRQVLVVTKLNGPQTCRIAYVDAHQPNANVIARQVADDHALGFRCGVDRPLRSGDPAWFD